VEAEAKVAIQPIKHAKNMKIIIKKYYLTQGMVRQI